MLNLSQLSKRSQPVAVKLIIQSQDPEIYWVEAEMHGTSYGVTGDNGQRRMTRSLAAMKRSLAKVGYSAAILRHRSSFDEMIGNPVAGSDLAFEMPIVVSHERSLLRLNPGC